MNELIKEIETRCIRIKGYCDIKNGIVDTTEVLNSLKEQMEYYKVDINKHKINTEIEYSSNSPTAKVKMWVIK